MNSVQLRISNPLSYTKILEKLNKKNIIKTIQFYGFVECAKMLRFLSIVIDSDVIDVPAFKYLLSLLNECIENNANGYITQGNFTYFKPIVKLRDEIEYITSISNH